MQVNRFDLFPIPITYISEFIPMKLVEGITEYIMSVKEKATKHNVFYGDAVSMHNTGTDTSLIEDIMLKVRGCGRLQENITTCIKDYASGAGYPEMQINNSWFNIQNKNSILNRHMHIGLESRQPSSFVSGALYINVDDRSSPIMFDNPNPYSFINFSSHVDHTKYNLTNFCFHPKRGDLILFPSWLIHSAPEPNGMDNRIIISFNTKYQA